MHNTLPTKHQHLPQTSSQEPLMSTFPVTKRKRATRAKFAKVRTGCVTCKKRHVKCDETKPACRNCIKWAGYCGGYEPTHGQYKSTKTKPSTTKPLIALSSPDVDDTPSPEELDMAPQDLFWQLQSMAGSLSPPASIDFQNSPCTYSTYADTSHFASVQPGMVFDDKFWKFTLPQLVQDSAAMGYAMTAVHALIFSKCPEFVSLGKASGCDYYGQALISYGRALSETRRATTQQTDLREAVVCCMFFVIFETLNGDRESAHAHLQSGQRLLRELGADDFHQNLRGVLQYLVQQVRESGFDGMNGLAGEARCEILESLVL